MRQFEDERYYRTNDPTLAMIARPGVLAQWRHYGRGPAYVKLGGHVLYRAADLNAWLDARRIEPRVSGG